MKLESYSIGIGITEGAKTMTKTFWMFRIMILITFVKIKIIGDSYLLFSLMRKDRLDVLFVPQHLLS